MAITNLTNTTGKFNDTVALGDLTNATYALTLEDSKGNTYTNIVKYVGAQPQPVRLELSTTDDDSSSTVVIVSKIATTGDETGNSAFSDKIIKFTGGTDVTNSTFITGLEANALLYEEYPLINHLNVGGIEYEINDARVSSGTDAPSTAVPNPKEGDIYFQSVGDIQTSDGWSYVIGPGGLCRMWKPVNIGSKTTDHWGGNVHCIDAIMPTQTYPVTFKEPPCVFQMASCDNYNFGIFNCYSGQLATVDHPHQISIGRYGSQGSPINICVGLFVIGQV